MTESKGKYNFTDCKPISKTDQKNKVKLWNKYNKILQKDKVYKDIEMWSSYNSDESTQEIRFSGKRLGRRNWL